MNRQESIKALCLLTYKLRKCSHSAFISLDLSYRLMNALQNSPAHIIKPHTYEIKNPSLSHLTSPLQPNAAYKNSLYKQTSPAYYLEITRPCEHTHPTLLSTNAKQELHSIWHFLKISITQKFPQLLSFLKKYWTQELHPITNIMGNYSPL